MDPKLNFRVLDPDKIEKARIKLAKRLNSKPTFKATTEMDIAMFITALRSQLRKGAVLAGLANTVASLLHDSIHDRINLLIEDIERGDLSPEDLRRAKKELEYRDSEHEGLIEAERMRKEMGVPSMAGPCPTKIDPRYSPKIAPLNKKKLTVH